MALTEVLSSLFKSASDQTGISANYFQKVAGIESSFNTNAQSKVPGSTAGGLFGFIDNTWNSLGGGNKYSASDQMSNMIGLTTSNQSFLSKALGRSPTEGELYLAHQQGASGAAALLANPLASAASIVGLNSVVQNGGSADMTAGAFASLWTDKFDGAGAVTPGRQSTNVIDQSGPNGNGTAALTAAESWFVRAAVIVTGFIFLGVGLAMFKPNTVLVPAPLKGVAKGLT